MAPYYRPELRVDAVQILKDIAAGVDDQRSSLSKTVIAHRGDWLVTYPDGRQLFVTDSAFKAEFKSGGGTSSRNS